MSTEDYLLKIAHEIAALEDRFVSSHQLGLYLKTEDAADYKRLAVEAKSILDAELGLLNNFSTNLLFPMNSGAAPLLVAPQRLVWLRCERLSKAPLITFAAD